MNAAKRLPKVIGLSTSLRNARSNVGSDGLVADVRGKGTRSELHAYLRERSRPVRDGTIRAPSDQRPVQTHGCFNSEKRRPHGPLSNSALAMAAALWGAKNQGVDIDHVDLSQYFPPHGEPVDLEVLKKQLETADGFLLSGPVYFGDRSSVAQSFIEMARSEKRLREYLRGKIYAGVAVGAKRNGGQETTLVYQMLDMMNLGLLAVGNDSETTSQYGGTGKAGDVGTMVDDDYGLDTSVGAGNRLGRIVQLSSMAKGYRLKGKLRVSVWLLQDKDQLAYKTIRFLADKLQPDKVQVHIMDFTERYIHRCIACDICPTHVDVDGEYRCVIKHDEDLFHKDHAKLIDADAILLAAYSPEDRENVKSVYQKFIERTRYLRRGDYVLSDILVAPLVLEDVGSQENMHMRIMTSMIRHHTIMHCPVIGRLWRGQLLNQSDVLSKLKGFFDDAAHLTAGRLTRARLAEGQAETTYNPLGYDWSVEGDKEETVIRKREAATRLRREKLSEDGKSRLVSR